MMSPSDFGKWQYDQIVFYVEVNKQIRFRVLDVGFNPQSECTRPKPVQYEAGKDLKQQPQLQEPPVSPMIVIGGFDLTMDGFGMVNWWIGEDETPDPSLGWLDPEEQKSLTVVQETKPVEVAAHVPVIANAPEIQYVEQDDGYDPDEGGGAEANEDY